MAAETTPPASWETFRMLAQIFVAFGQGSGQLAVADDAIRAAVNDYGRHVEIAGWRSAAPVVLSSARVMGQAAAHHALANRRAIITADDYRAAQAILHEMNDEAAELLGSCPWDLLPR